MKSGSSFTAPLLAGLSSLSLLAGCTLAPIHPKPDMALPAQYKEAPQPPAEAPWKLAQPADTHARGEWWRVFDDATLNALEQQALEANQNLRIAAARLGQARALEHSARAALFPQVGIGFGPTRQQASPAAQGLAANADTRAQTLWRGQTSVAYEVDLFGRLDNTANAARLDAERDEALFHATLLALQGDVAQAYFWVRELDGTQALYADTVKLRQETLRLLQRRFDAGDIGELELAQARTELAAAEAEVAGVARQRAVAEHALAILLGKSPASFSLPPRPIARLQVEVPTGLPSALLERRPDIAAAERSMAAANARIGAAKAAYFPRLSLTGTLGYESGRLGDLFKSASQAYVLGPLVGTLLTLPVLDGGAREAGVAQANSVYAEAVAQYRQSILQAFKEVEDNLAQLRLLNEQNAAQDRAVEAAQRAAHLSHVRYREGAISYFNVIDADRSVLQHQRTAVTLDGERARATVNLIRALGGGWSAETSKGLDPLAIR